MMKAIFKKEINSYFNSPLGYVFIAVFVLVTAMFFSLYNLFTGVGDITYIFSNITLFNSSKISESLRLEAISLEVGSEKQSFAHASKYSIGVI